MVTHAIPTASSVLLMPWVGLGLGLGSGLGLGLTSVPSSGPVNEAISSCRVGGGHVNLALHTLHSWWRGSLVRVEVRVS